MILQEISRDQTIELGHTLSHYHAAGAKVIPTTGELDWRLFSSARNRALLAYQRVGQLMHPWDQGWQKQIELTEQRLTDDKEAIADTGITEGHMVKMIAEYEELKKRRSDKASGRPA